jgi:hypothetical protein
MEDALANPRFDESTLFGLEPAKRAQLADGAALAIGRTDGCLRLHVASVKKSNVGSHEGSSVGALGAQVVRGAKTAIASRAGIHECIRARPSGSIVS